MQNNIYTKPQNIKRIFITSSQRQYVNKLKQDATEICREEFGEYINKVLNKFKEGYIYVHGNEIIGFILWTIKTTEPPKYDKDILLRKDPPPYDKYQYMYIHLLCGKKTNTDFGYSMLDDAETYCAKKSLLKMVLEPLNIRLEQYYRKYGFKMMYNGDIYAYPILMHKPLTELLEDYSKVNRRTTRKAKKLYLAEDKKRILKSISENIDMIDRDLTDSRNNTLNIIKSFNKFPEMQATLDSYYSNENEAERT